MPTIFFIAFGAEVNMQANVDGMIDTERSCEEVRKVMADYLNFIWNIKSIAMEKEAITDGDKQNQLREIATLISSEELVEYYFKYKEEFSICFDNPKLKTKECNIKA